jgi:hypothetical protein
MLLIYTVLKLNSNRRPKTKKADISVNLFPEVAQIGITSNQFWVDLTRISNLAFISR